MAGDIIFSAGKGFNGLNGHNPSALLQYPECPELKGTVVGRTKR